MNLTSKLKKVRDALNDINVSVYHYDGADKSKDYIVWAESGEGDSLSLDNRIDAQVITGTIDFFTKTEYSSVIDDIQEALDNANISFSLNSVQFEEETRQIHYEWIFEV